MYSLKSLFFISSLILLNPKINVFANDFCSEVQSFLNIFNLDNDIYFQTRNQKFWKLKQKNLDKNIGIPYKNIQLDSDIEFFLQPFGLYLNK